MLWENLREEEFAKAMLEAAVEKLASQIKFIKEENVSVEDAKTRAESL